MCSLSRDSGPTVGTLPVVQSGVRIAPLAVKSADHSCIVVSSQRLNESSNIVLT